MAHLMAETALPEPLVPPEIDLRGFAFMPLDVVRLRDSGLAIEASGDEFRAAVLLWCASWHQVPAASLPLDERGLAALAGYGRDLKGWRRVRAGALRGWVECQDGRIYHPVIAQKAIEAMSHKDAAKRKREQDAERLRRWREGRSETPSETGDETRFVAERQDQTRSDRTGSDRKRPEPPPAASNARATDPRLAAAAAAGAYLDFRGEDLTAAWAVELGELDPETITAVLSKERLPDGGRIRLPSGFAAALAAVRERERDVARRERAKARAAAEDQAEADRRARAEAERPEREARAREADEARRRREAEASAAADAERARHDEEDAQAMANAVAIVAAADANSALMARAPARAAGCLERLRQAIEQGRVLTVSVEALLHEVPGLRASLP